MKVKQWVDFGQEVEIDVSITDIRAALGECFENVTQDRIGEEGPSVGDVLHALNSIAKFFNAMTDEQIALLSEKARIMVGNFLSDQEKRFKIDKR